MREMRSEQVWKTSITSQSESYGAREFQKYSKKLSGFRIRVNSEEDSVFREDEIMQQIMIKTVDQEIHFFGQNNDTAFLTTPIFLQQFCYRANENFSLRNFYSCTEGTSAGASLFHSTTPQSSKHNIAICI